MSIQFLPQPGERQLACANDDDVLAMVTRHGRIELAAALTSLRETCPEITSFELADSASRLHRRGLIRIGEELRQVQGKTIRTAILTLP